MRLTILLFLILASYGCERDTDNGPEPSADPKLVFHVPKDGRLTEKQLADYIAIRQKIVHDVKVQKLARQNYLAENRQEPNAGTEFPYFDDIEKSAANAYSMSYDEFLWIKDTVISTQTTMMVQHYYELNKKIMTLLDKTLTRYDEINAERPGGQEQQQMDNYVEEMKGEMERLREKIPDSNDQPAALKHNIVIVSRFKKELEELEQQSSQTFAP